MTGTLKEDEDVRWVGRGWRTAGVLLLLITHGAFPHAARCFTIRPSDVGEAPSTGVQLINHTSFLM